MHPACSAHHTDFTRYCVALDLLLRWAARRPVLPPAGGRGAPVVAGSNAVHDKKQGGDALMAQPTLLNALTREQIRL